MNLGVGGLEVQFPFAVRVLVQPLRQLVRVPLEYLLEVDDVRAAARDGLPDLRDVAGVRTVLGPVVAKRPEPRLVPMALADVEGEHPHVARSPRRADVGEGRRAATARGRTPAVENATKEPSLHAELFVHVGADLASDLAHVPDQRCLGLVLGLEGQARPGRVGRETPHPGLRARDARESAPRSNVIGDVTIGAGGEGSGCGSWGRNEASPGMVMASSTSVNTGAETWRSPRAAAAPPPHRPPWTV